MVQLILDSKDCPLACFRARKEWIEEPSLTVVARDVTGIRAVARKELS